MRIGYTVSISVRETELWLLRLLRLLVGLALTLRDHLLGGRAVALRRGRLGLVLSHVRVRYDVTSHVLMLHTLGEDRTRLRLGAVASVVLEAAERPEPAVGARVVRVAERAEAVVRVVLAFSIITKTSKSTKIRIIRSMAMKKHPSKRRTWMSSVQIRPLLRKCSSDR